MIWFALSILRLQLSTLQGSTGAMSKASVRREPHHREGLPVFQVERDSRPADAGTSPVVQVLLVLGGVTALGRAVESRLLEGAHN